MKSAEVVGFESTTLVGDKATLLEALGVVSDRVSNSAPRATAVGADLVETEALLVKIDNKLSRI